jgi:hypothetical protein
VITGVSIDQLRRNADAIAAFADAAFDDVADTEIATYDSNIRRLSLLGE